MHFRSASLLESNTHDALRSTKSATAYMKKNPEREKTRYAVELFCISLLCRRFQKQTGKCPENEQSSQQIDTGEALIGLDATDRDLLAVFRDHASQVWKPALRISPQKESGNDRPRKRLLPTSCLRRV